MQKKLFGNIALLIVINVLVKPFWILFIDMEVQNRLGYEDYGKYISVFNMALILTMLLDFGINNYNSTGIAKHPETISQQFSELFSFKLLLSFIYLSLTALLAWLYGFDSTGLGYVMLLAASQVFAYFATFTRSSISGLHLFKTDALLSGIDRFVMILLGLIMLYSGFVQTDILHYIWIQIAGYVSVWLIALCYLWKYIREFRFRFHWQTMKNVLMKTYPYAVLAFMMLLYTRIDVLMIKKLLVNGDLQNGYYARAFRLLEASTLMVGTTATILLPTFARMLAEKRSIETLTRNLICIVLIPVISFSVWCACFAPQVMQLISGHSQPEVNSAFRLLMLAFIPYSCMYLFGTMLTANAEIKTLNRIALSGLVINLSLNFILIPYLGAQGAAITALITQSVVGFGKMRAAFRSMNIPILVSFWRAFIVLACIIIMLAMTFSYFEVHYLLAASVLACVGVIGMFHTHLLSFDAVRNMYKSLSDR